MHTNKKKIQLEEESIGNWDYTFCGILDPDAVQNCAKFLSFITNALLQLVGDIIKGVW